MLNLERLKNLVQEAFINVLDAHDKSLSLVVGNTGSGKSTLVNYLLGYSFKKGMDDVIESLDSSPPAKMGDSSESITLYPTLYTNLAKMAYCDCPGFMDTRNEEEKVCASIALEMIVKSALKISSIVLVIDYTSLVMGRGESLKKLCNQLGLILKHPEAAAPSLCIVLTRTPKKVTLQHIIDKITQIIDSERKKLQGEDHILKKFRQQLEEGLLTEKYVLEREQEVNSICRTITLLSLIKANAHNICIVDVLDAGESRHKINTIINYVKPIDKHLFDFNQYDMARLHFNEVIADIMFNAINLFTKKRELPLKIQHCETEIKDLQAQILFHHDQIKDIYTEKFDEIQKPIYLSKQEEKLRQNKTKSEQLATEKALNLQALEKLQNEFDELDADTPVLYWKDSYKKDNSTATAVADIMGMVLGVEWLVDIGKVVVNGLADDKRFTYNGIPFINVERQCDSGGFYKERSYPSNGEYSVIYKGEYTGSRAAEIRIYAEKKMIPANKRLIEMLQNKININKLQYDELDKNLERLITEKNVLSNTIQDLQKSSSDQHNDLHIKKYMAIVHDFETHKTDLQIKHLNLENELKQVEKAVNDNLCLYEIIKKINMFTEYGVSPLQQEFMDSVTLIAKNENGDVAPLDIKAPTPASHDAVKTLFFKSTDSNRLDSKSNSSNNNELSTDRLQAEIKITKEQIAALQVKLTQLEQEFEQKQLQEASVIKYTVS